jgi:hypothetical protein
MNLLKKMTTCFLLVYLLLLIQSCATLTGKPTSPDNSNCSLIYGQIDINQEKAAHTYVYFTTWDFKQEYIESEQKNSAYNYFEKKSIDQKYNYGIPVTVIDMETGVFALEIKDPGDYILDRIWIQDKGFQTSQSNKIYMFNLPESPENGVAVKSGEMVYYGAQKLNSLEKGNAELEPNINKTRKEVLEQVEILLSGKGWEDWIARERASLN